MIILNEKEHNKDVPVKYDKLKTKFWGEAGAGCIILARNTGRMLIPLRSDEVREPRTWGTWGGAIDKNENPVEAMKREVKEETGYVGEAEVIPLYKFFDNTGFSYSNYLMIVENEFKPKINWETIYTKWFYFDEMPTPLHFGMFNILKDKKSWDIIRKYAKKMNENMKKIKLTTLIEQIVEKLNEENFEGIHITKDEYDMLTKTTNYVKSVLINKENDGILVKENENGFLNEIIDYLCKQNVLDYDVDEGIDFYFLAYEYADENTMSIKPEYENQISQMIDEAADQTYDVIMK